MNYQNQLRSRADELKRLTEELGGDAAVNRKLVAVLKASILSELLPIFATMVDLAEASSATGEENGDAVSLSKAIVDRNNAIREASARYDYDEVTRIANEYAAASAARRDDKRGGG